MSSLDLTDTQNLDSFDYKFLLSRIYRFAKNKNSEQQGALVG